MTSEEAVSYLNEYMDVGGMHNLITLCEHFLDNNFSITDVVNYSDILEKNEFGDIIYGDKNGYIVLYDGEVYVTIWANGFIEVGLSINYDTKSLLNQVDSMVNFAKTIGGK